MKEKTLVSLFCGLGGYDYGALSATVEYSGQVYKYRLLASIDCDPVACLNHDNIIGEKKAVVMDLFSRKQYIAFHGQEPPADWEEVTPWDLWVAFGYQVPNTVFLSPPCKGLSGLLPEQSAKSEKYQALNELTVRGIELTLRACDLYGGSVPDIIHFENVPRITSRGKHLLKQIRNLLIKYGYAIDMNPKHNLGEIGGLGQNRVRFLIMARQEKKIPNPIYLPQKKRLKSIGEVIGHLPLPGDVKACGWMHRVPKLQWKTWVRLALIPAGGDWRDLQRDCYANIYQVVPFDNPAPTVTGSHRPNNGAISLADPRLGYEPRGGAFRIQKWDEPGPTITGSTGAGRSNGISGVADPRLENVQGYGNKYHIVGWDESAPVVTGSRIGSGAVLISDMRINHNSRPNLFGVADWNEPAKTVTGSSSVSSSNGVAAIADPRLNCSPRAGSYKVQHWEESASTVTSADLHSGSAAIADPRIPNETENGVWMIISEDGTWHRPLTTFELGMLQSFPMFLPDGRPFQLDGCSDSKAREYIGNAYPPDAAEATCECTLMALAKADAKIEFELTNETIWVTPIEDKDDQRIKRCSI
ncbi:DNA cytosine methyltransferase [Dehalobacter sp. DCM]|uniref:DNA cytosine methyltransferase n=1 Tax=Dehalobacter sp. DCM TaxID=2907827 RepID=UPI003081A557|nr:DNA cytosine methyltransferase [Dehalobacter sp. DCM]